MRCADGLRRLTTKEAAMLYARRGLAPPHELAAPSTEHIRNTRRKTVDNIQFRSTLEADAYQILKSWQRAGAITNLELQPRFLLQPKFRHEGKTIRAMHYTADFRFVRNFRTVVLECKGFRTQPYMQRRKQFLFRYPEVIFEEWRREDVAKWSKS